MTIFATILSILALLGATISVFLVLDERKRNKKRNTALLQYVDSKITETKQDIIERIKALEDGAVPDYEKAKAAANAVNNFNDGISGILGFDPYKALQVQRGAANGGDKV